MEKKTFLVIGGTSGIGKAVSEQLASAGHAVLATYRQSRGLPDVPGVTYLHFDAKETPDFSSVPDVLNGLVYCPGTIQLKPFNRLTDEDIHEEFTVNVIGATRVIRSCHDRLKRSAESASIVLFSTVAVKVGMQFHSSIAISKGAVEGLTRSLAAEFAPYIRVNAIAPSLVNTRLSKHLIDSEKKLDLTMKRHPLKQIGQPEDLAQMVIYLLGSSAKWCTGQIFHIDGGMSSVKLFA